MSIWIVPQHGKVTEAGSEATGLIGKTLEEVHRLLRVGKENRIYRIASSRHTCADWPWDICGACKEEKFDVDASTVYLIEPCANRAE